MNCNKNGMDVEDIKSALRKKYGPLTSISEQLGFNRNAISSAIRVSGYSIPLEITIADLLGKKPFEVWGADRFNQDGTPVKRFSRKQTFKAVPARLRKETSA